MPVNKDALVRYRILNKCLVSKHRKFPSKEDLREACREALGLDYLSDRTIEKDLEDMRYNEELGFLAPIAYSKKEKGYFYSDPDYSIDKIPLRLDDLDALRFAGSLLQQFSHLSILQGFSGAVAKIMEAMNINRMMMEQETLDFIEFDQAGYIPGGPFLESIVNAIKTNRKISFSYKKHGQFRQKKYCLDPYLLKEFKNIWYVVGQEDSSGKVKTFGLDRILDLEISQSEFNPDPDFDRKKYFKNAFGITSYHSEPDNVILSFTPKTGDFIKALPLHPSQQVLVDNEQECRISLIVYPTYDLIMQLLSYGSEVKVIEPPSLRQSVIKSLTETLEKYHRNP